MTTFRKYDDFQKYALSIIYFNKYINLILIFFPQSESWEDAACREVCEETGIHITNVKFCHVVNTVVPDIDYHYVTIFMKGEVTECGPSEPENKEPDKCEGITLFKQCIC